MAHIISCGHTDCPTLMSFTMTAYVFILLTQSVGTRAAMTKLTASSDVRVRGAVESC